jgi:hypothetical protein
LFVFVYGNPDSGTNWLDKPECRARVRSKERKREREREKEKEREREMMDAEFFCHCPE